MKSIKRLLICFLCLVLLSGCGKQEIPVPEPTVPDPVTPEQYLVLYRPILANYARALAENWSMEQYESAGLSTQVPNQLGNFAAEALGYALLDLDGDGVMELLVGDCSQSMLMDGYRLENGEPERIFVSGCALGSIQEADPEILWDEWRLCLDSDGSYFLFHEVQKTWLFCGYFPTDLKDGKLLVTQGYLYDSGFDSDAPWYRVDGYEFEHTPEQGISMEEGDMAVYRLQSAAVSINTLTTCCRFSDFQ